MADRNGKPVSRRDFLRRTALGAAVTGVGGVLAACGVSTAAPPSAASSAAQASAATSTAAQASVAAASTAAAPAASTAAGTATLEYWTGWSGYEFDQLKKLVDEYNGENPEQALNMTTVFGQYEKVLTAISAGNPPDVVSAVWMRQLPAMASRSALTPIDSYVQAAGINAADFFPQLERSWHYDGKQYGMAVTISSSMLVFNTAAWEAAGLDPAAAPQTLDEFDEQNRKLFKVNNGTIEQVGYVPTDLYLWGNVFGGSFYDQANNKITANDPKIVAALDWIAGYAKEYDVTKLDTFSDGFGDYLSANNPLFVGKQAGADAGEWITGIVKQYAPDTKLTFMAPPPPNDGKEMVTTFDGSIFTIPTGAKAPDASWAFIEWLQRPPNLERFASSINNLPTRVASAEKPEFTEPAGYELSKELLASPNAQAPLPLPVFDQYFAELQTTVDAARRGTTPAQQALDELTEKMQAELERSAR